ncbi:hypothetical protein AP060_00706 [Pseudomonas sp. TAD18]|nr:hypothetical protein AP060_00706 [Pseudomonas sp. TAD18]KVV09901.1 hypothetical protein AP059_00636 [Pseudomonas sp. TAA207]
MSIKISSNEIIPPFEYCLTSMNSLVNFFEP